MARVLAHAHSTWSHDGVLTLSDWAEIAVRIGCDTVMLSEHEETGWDADRYAEYVAACAAASPAGITLLPGIEFNQETFHVLCYGLKTWPNRPSGARDLVKAVHEQGCLLCLAHPGKYRWSFPAELVHVADAVEVWNSKWIYDGTLGPHPRSWELARGKRAFVGQDVHKRKHLTRLYFETDSANALDDLTRGDYRVVFEERSWSPEDLRCKTATACAQRLRTQLLQRALSAYRLTRPLRQRLSQLLVENCLAW